MVLIRQLAGRLRTAILLLVCCTVLSVSGPVSADKPHILKFATLAPAGSTWMDLLRDWANEVRQRSNGRLIFKIYPGGVQGDEPDVLKKIRFGQLQGGAFTGYGIGHFYSPARALELPFLFESIEEIDYVRGRFMPEIEQGYRDNGYEMLGWMEVGYVYFFSRYPINTIDDLKSRRIWHWTGDPMSQAFFDASGIAPIPLSIIDVYTSLSTGLIDTVYCPPLGAIALQWFTKTSYITNVPMANGIGSLVVSRRFYQNLPQDLQKLLKSTGEATGRKLIEATRRDNIESLEVLRTKGMQFTLNPEDVDQALVEEISQKAGESLMKSNYIPEETIASIRRWIDEYRAQSATSTPEPAHQPEPDPEPVDAAR